MSAIPFPGSDILRQHEKLREAGFSEQQAKAQLEAMQSVAGAYDASARKELATKGDIQDVRNEIQDVRYEIQDVRNELQQVRVEIERSHNSLLAWMFVLIVGLAASIWGALAYFK